MSVSLVQAALGAAFPSPTPSRSRLKACWYENDRVADGLDFGLATDRDALEEAFRLVHDQYVAQGYMDPHPSGWRLSIHNALPSTRVFVARAGGRVVATITLIVDSPLGLPMDEIYADDLRGLRGERRDLAEVSGLAVHPDYQSSGVAILLRLFRMLVLYAAEMARLSDLCIAVNPHHAAFYRKAFHFRILGGLKQYRKVNGAPAVALRLDLALARALMRELRDGHPVIGEVYSFLFSPGNFERVMARLVEDLEQVSPRAAHIAHFLSRHEAWAKASRAERAYLLACWGTSAALEPLPPRPGAPDPAGALDCEGCLGLALA